MKTHRTYTTGFTMIEILIVVSVIAVLAAIAVPNFLEAQVRSKVSRTVQDFEFIALALETYFADYGKYPPVSPLIKSKEEPVCEEVLVRVVRSRFSYAPLGPNSFEVAGHDESTTPGLVTPDTDVGVMFPPEMIESGMFGPPCPGLEPEVQRPIEKKEPCPGLEPEVQRPIEKKEPFPELLEAQTYSEEEKKTIHNRTQQIEAARLKYYYEDLFNYHIITPETVKNEVLRLDMPGVEPEPPRKGEPELIPPEMMGEPFQFKEPDEPFPYSDEEMIRLKVFKFEVQYYNGEQIPASIVKAQVINQYQYDMSLYRLTTPISYISKEILPDSFASVREQPFGYLNFTQIDTEGIKIEEIGRNALYALTSCAPDNEGTPINILPIPYISYDPTNGTVSPGDIVRFSD